MFYTWIITSIRSIFLRSFPKWKGFTRVSSSFFFSCFVIAGWLQLSPINADYITQSHRVIGLLYVIHGLRCHSLHTVFIGRTVFDSDKRILRVFYFCVLNEPTFSWISWWLIRPWRREKWSTSMQPFSRGWVALHCAVCQTSSKRNSRDDASFIIGAVDCKVMF